MITTNPEMNAKLVGILRTGGGESQYAAQRIEELEAEAVGLRALITKVRLEVFGPRTPYPSKEVRPLWDEMRAAEAASPPVSPG